MMKITLICFFVLFYSFVVFSAPALSDEEEWQQFKNVQHKLYQTKDEEAIRFQIFKNNLKKIREHNEQYERGETTFKEGVNQFSDLTLEEFKKMYAHGTLSHKNEDETGHQYA